MSNSTDEKAAIYVRSNQTDPAIIEKQVNRLREHAAQQGYRNPLVYIDAGWSGLNFNRPAFNRLRRDIQAGQIEVIMVESLSRISRDSIKLVTWFEELNKSGIRLDSMTEPSSLLSNSVLAEYIEVIAGVNAKECNQKSNQHER